jgi:hypothetical protein
MKVTLVIASTLCVLGSSATAGNVSIRARGTVSGNSLSVSPLAGASFGAPVEVTFDVTTPGVPWTMAPADGSSYTIDPSTFTIDVAGAQLGMLSSSEALTLIDGFPVSDRLHIDVGGLENSLSMAYQVGYTGPTFSSLDITEQYGLYDFATLTSFNWIISGSGVGAMFIDYTDVEIIASAPGVPFCFGDGTGTACPCLNTGGAGEGCANSGGSGCSIGSSGSASVAAADLVLTAAQSTTGQPGLFFQGDNAINGGMGVLFGDGLRCAGGSVVRLEVAFSDGSGSSATSIDLGAKGGVAAGDTRHYQYWYRDPSGLPCGSAFNLSNGLTIDWTL